MDRQEIVTEISKAAKEMARLERPAVRYRAIAGTAKQLEAYWLKLKSKRRRHKELTEALDILTDLCNATPDHQDWKTELLFHEERKWRFDYASYGLKLAIEINGGVHTQGRHTRGQGFKGDMQKLNAAQLLGWVVLQYTPGMRKAMARDVKLYI